MNEEDVIYTHNGIVHACVCVCVCVCVCTKSLQLCLTLCNLVGYHALFQGIIPIHGSNLHCR